MSYLENISWTEITTSFWEKRDQRMDDYFMMNTPITTIWLMIIYFVSCIKLGPTFMKTKKPYEVRPAILIFNVIMVCVNTYICYQTWILALGKDYNWFCQPLDRTTNERSVKIAHIMWIYYICKFMDWFDTFFFILRKKFSHVSPLHIYHHSLMPSAAWLIARFMPGGTTIWLPFLNSGVHAVMHTYYALSALGPQYHKYLWWKKYLTQLQIAQFVILFIIAVLDVFILECGIDLPLQWTYIVFVGAFIFFYLFRNFYIETYSRSEQKNNAKKVS